MTEEEHPGYYKGSTKATESNILQIHEWTRRISEDETNRQN